MSLILMIYKLFLQEKKQFHKLLILGKDKIILIIIRHLGDHKICLMI